LEEIEFQTWKAAAATTIAYRCVDGLVAMNMTAKTSSEVTPQAPRRGIPGTNQVKIMLQMIDVMAMILKLSLMDLY